MKRQTYGAVTRPEQQIRAFIEESGNDSSAPAISSSSFSVKNSKSPTVFVGIVPTNSGDEEDPFDVLTVHQDGHVRRLSPDLKTQRWSVRHGELAKASSTHEVHTCFLVEFEDARKSLFKRRPDLAALAMGSLSGSGVDEPSILLLASHPTDSKQVSLKDVTVQMFSVPANASGDVVLDENQRMRHLLTMNIPGVDGLERIANKNLQWSFHSGSAGLSLSFDKGFVNFDLSRYSPTVTSQFILQDEQFSSIMRISPQSVIGAGKSLVAVYDTQYKSVQRNIAVDDLPSGSPEGIMFIGYFAKLGIAIATRGNTLFAFDLTSSNSSLGSLKRPRDGLLIDAIGRGLGQSETPSKRHCPDVATLGLTSREQVAKWDELSRNLDKSAKAKDADAFDAAVRTYFGSKSLPPAPNVHPEVPLFLLSKIFSLKETENKDRMSASSSFRLAIELWPKNTCRWLIQMGHFSISNIEIALRRSFKPRILPSLPVGSFTQALIHSEPTLRHLNHALQSPIPMTPDELAYALRTSINMARSSSTTLEEPAKAITNTDHSETQDLTHHGAEGEGEAPLSSIFRALNTTLHLLHAYPPQSTTSALRSILPKTDLIVLVHHLRLSLATGGYTARFTEDPPTPVTPSQTNPRLSLSTITNLLSASIDAIGPSGWITASLGGTEASEDAELDLIADMKSEISAALAGVEEASYLKGLLREFLGFGDSLAASSSSSSRAPAAATSGDTTSDHPTPLVRFEKLNGADVLVFPSSADDGADFPPSAAAAGGDDAAGRMLPLSLKAPTGEGDVSRTKVKRTTGEVRSRSSREIGHLRRKRGGRYAFERLIV